MPTGNTTKEKLKLACYWACSCGGCDVAVLDTNAKILDLADAADIVFWPVAVDGKKVDIEAMSDRSIDICLMNGAIRTEENREMALLLRRKSKILVAFGTCAHTGGIHGLINTTNAGTIRETVFIDSPSIDNPEGTIPKTRVVMPAGELELPDLFDTVCRLEDVVPVDYSVPGCPPAAARVGEIIDAILAGKLPPRGTVLGASDKALCETCPRRPRDGSPADFTRPHLARSNAATCFLERGIVCLGPVTRGGCGEQCVGGGMPCIGCYGPTPGTLDTGGAMIGVLASLIESRDPAEIERMAGSVRDPLGTFYLFTMARSLLRNVRRT